MREPVEPANPHTVPHIRGYGTGRGTIMGTIRTFEPVEPYDHFERTTAEVVREYVEEVAHAGGFSGRVLGFQELATDVVRYGIQSGQVMDAGMVTFLVSQVN